MNTEKWFGSYGSSGNNNGDADCNEMDVKRGGREMNVQEWHNQIWVFHLGE